MKLPMSFLWTGLVLAGFVCNYNRGEAGRNRGPVRDMSLNKSRSEFQAAFFEFSSELFKWTAYFASKRKYHDEPLSEIYFRVDKEKIMKFSSLFGSYRDVLVAMNSYGDLNQIEKIPIIPDELYQFMRERFGISKVMEIMDPGQLLLKVVGGDFDFGNGKKVHISGLLEFVDDYNINQWLPVKKFIRNFGDTLALDARLSQQIGKTLLPLAKFYYVYMDPVSRLRIFKELAVDYKYIDLTGKDRGRDIDQLAVKVFQNSGPVMIKLLQQLQEEVPGTSPMTNVLAGLKHSKPMSPARAEKMARTELKRLTGDLALEGFSFKREPLGIASIAQTHLFSYRNRKYVVKIQKDKIEDIFSREREFLKRMVSEEDIFDKGMKQKIANTNEGIFEEVDFNFERKYIEIGEQAYTDQERKIYTVNNPPMLNKRAVRGNPQVLIMSLAQGSPLGSIMTKEDPDDLHKAYLGIQNLYEKFLLTALSAGLERHFYHGDLHRENIFFHPESERVTLIDFGNAGSLDGFMRKSIMEILYYTKKTDTSSEELLDQAIIDLGGVMQNFVLKYNESRTRKSQVTAPLIKTYFRACFNPQGTVNQKIYEGKQLLEKKRDLVSAKRQMELLLDQNIGIVSQEKIDLIQDDIDFIKAMAGNCLNGATNPLMGVLASKALISDKLNVIFHELQKNGIAMPKEVIFFNKSKSLLEGILMNLSSQLDKAAVDYEYVEPDVIYHKALEIAGGHLSEEVENITSKESQENTVVEGSTIDYKSQQDETDSLEGAL